MNTNDHELQAGIRVWLERAGQAVLGPGRLDLLQAIDRCHSISAAARQMGMSYRRAWLLVQRINGAAGEPLVDAVVGGTQGGGACLTPRGRQTVVLFDSFQKHLQFTAAALWPRLLHESETAPSIHVAAALSLEDVLGQVLADFACRQPATPVRVMFAASDELADHILAGAKFDLFLAADARQTDRLAAANLIEPGVRAPLAGNRLAVLARANHPGRIRKAADLLREERQRIALAKPSTPLGNYSIGYLQTQGVYEAVLPRSLLLDNSRAVIDAVRACRADLGLVYSSSAAHAVGCRVLFRPPAGEVPICFTAAVLRRSPASAQARDLLDYLLSPVAARRFRNCGFRPLPSRPA